MALPAETITTDIHCAMKRSKLVSTCCGVALDALLDRIVTAAEHLSVWSDGGYTTNPSIENFVDGNAGVVYKYDGDPLETEHGGPDGLLVPNLYFWKRAKWVRGLLVTAGNEPGLWATDGYHDHGDPWQQRYRVD